MLDTELVEKLREQFLQVEAHTTDIHQVKKFLLDIVLRLDARQLYWVCDVFFTVVSCGVAPPEDQVDVIDNTPFDDDPEREDTL